MAAKDTIRDESRQILIAEFEYIASTATQANEDRARVSSFYLIAVGSLVAALFSTQILDEKFNMQMLNTLLGGLFLILTMLGTLTITQLARLRGAWFESMLAMNQIKEYVISRDKDLKKAFRWRTNTAPPVYKMDSISYQQTFEVAILSALTFGAAVYCFQSGVGQAAPERIWLNVGISAPAAFAAQLLVYDFFIRRERKKLKLHE
jgi:hypothetical protein